MSVDPLDVPLAALAPPPPWTWRRCVLFALACVSLPLWLPIALTIITCFTFVGTPALLGWLALTRPKLLRGLPRDVRFIARLIMATRQLNTRMKRTRGEFTTADYFDEVVARHGGKPALVFEGVTHTYAQIDAEANRVAAWAAHRGLQAGDAVALLCGNRPEHLFCWLGLAKRGVATTLIPTALRGDSLTRALRECGVLLVLFEASAAGQLAPLVEAAAVIEPRPLRFVCLDALEAPSWAEALSLPAVAAAPQPGARSACRTTDTLVHIFTSGTTGLPKAARLTHLRFFSAIVLPYMFGLQPTDKLYCCLPMCHTAAIGAFSICWWLGIPLVLARKFSASTFWRDVARQECTIVQYVGELCRYLVHAPHSEHERTHRVRLFFGNGLRPDVWPRLVSRFGIPTIGEVYASTEGNANLANTENRPGAVGFISPLLKPLYPVCLVRLAETGEEEGAGELLRGADGLGVACAPGEAGELLGKVDQRDASRNFAGYTDKVATRRKLVRDVLRRGDCWFRTGDLLQADADGFVYFVDRIGDTFRYKGENVSTAEVAAVLGSSAELRIAHCIVYGVEVPHVDGRVGMAALELEHDAPPPTWHASSRRLASSCRPTRILASYVCCTARTPSRRHKPSSPRR